MDAGENTAKCRRDAFAGTMQFYFSQMITSGGLVGGPNVKVAPKPTPPKDHRAGDLLCECGFWAYFDEGNNPHHHKGEGQVYGVVDGWGIVTVGTRGFRAEKARIVALVIPPKRRTALHDRLAVNYPDVSIFPRRTDALDAFPLQAPPAPSPQGDPDFWTRETA